MGLAVSGGASLLCTFGTAPGQLMVLPTNRVMTKMPLANIMDYLPMVNIMPFGMCLSMSNPQVAAATSAAMGVLTPMPCVPVTAAPWTPGCPMVLIANMPALNNTCQCMCTWGGAITITNPGQQTIMVK
jgi:hypothetical protein